MKSFVRMTKLSNICGRSDYITDESRQEGILAHNSIDWTIYHEHELLNQKSAKANNEGRELVIALPNEWKDLEKEELARRVDFLSQRAIGADINQEYQWAVHWNQARTNLHAHVIFSERKLQLNDKATSRWDRDIYLTAEGKVARKKADRARNEDGSIKPPVHRKGELKDTSISTLSIKDKKYSRKDWLLEAKETVKETFKKEWNVDIEKQDYLHQYHEGKGSESSLIRQKNEIIKAVNYRLKDLERLNITSNFEKGVEAFKVNIKKGQYVIPYIGEDSRVHLTKLHSLKEASSFVAKTEELWGKGIKETQKAKAMLDCFTKVKDAQERYYNLLMDSKDDRRPMNLNTIKAPERFKTAYNDFLEAKRIEKSCLRNYNAYRGFWGLFKGKAKKEAYTEYSRAREYAEKLGAELQKDLKIDDTNLSICFEPDGSILNAVQMAFQRHLEDLERYKENELVNARPLDFKKPSKEAVNEARNAFIAEMEKVPEEEKERIRILINDTIPDKGNTMTSLKCRIEVKDLVKKHLPTQEEIRELNSIHLLTKAHGLFRGR